MLFNANGDYKPLGSSHQLYTFNAAGETVLPAWLTALGVSPVLAFVPSASGEIGSLSCSTKVATPTIGDAAGVQTMTVDTSLYSEIGFFVHGVVPDVGWVPANVNLRIAVGNYSTNGANYQSAYTATAEMTTRCYPGATENCYLQLMDTVNILKRKNMGMVIRPKTKEVFFTTGDPADGGSVVHYRRDFVDCITPFYFQIALRDVLRRTVKISQVKLRLSLF